MSRVNAAGFPDLDTETLYALLRLRVDVFVVEQACPYAELDGRDTEPDARHCWIADGGEVVAYMRLLADRSGATRLGRLATAPARRGEGLASRLVRHALEASDRPVVADVQAHLSDWYARFGFVVAGPGFVEDGIPHVPMRVD